MLSNPDMFDTIVSVCRERGVIDRFEAENGEIKGHMMIDTIDMPDDVSLYPNASGNIFAFEASFDFMDTRIGLALCIPSVEAASGIWFINGEEPDNVWVEFFVKTLVENIPPDGGFGVPLYTFLTDEASFTVVPTAPDSFEEVE